jgi:signal transduction histidine kinase
VQANDAHLSSFIAGMLVSADQRRVGEIGLSDPRTGEAMPVEAIAGKVLSEHGELTAVVTILHDRREALEKARLYTQLQVSGGRARAADSGGDRRHRAAERAAAPPGDRARAGVGAQVAVPREHVARVPDAAQRDARLHVDAAAGVAGDVDQPVKRQLGRIESNGRHLLTIINEILDISRIEAGRMPLQLSTFKIPDLGARGEVRARTDHHAVQADR